MPEARPTVSFADALEAARPKRPPLKIVTVIDQIRATSPADAAGIEHELEHGQASSRTIAEAITNILAPLGIDDTVCANAVAKHPRFRKR